MIQVIDSIMGSGKSTWMINYINNHPEQQYLIVVPYLSEVNRYMKSTINIVTFEPKNWDKSKIEDFKQLILERKNIITTHQLIKNIGADCLNLLRLQDYHLIIDEALEVVEKFDIDNDDMKIILENNYVTISENGFLRWNTDNPDAAEYDGEMYEDIKKCTQLDSLMVGSSIDSKNKILIWNYPYKFFQCFDKCHILTYLWDGAIQKYYFLLHDIKYEHLSLQNGELVPYNYYLDIAKRQKYRSLITILEDKKLNSIGDKISRAMPLSSTWYLKHKNKDEMKILKNNLYNFFRHKAGTPMIDNMWGCYSDYQSKLKGKGYTGSKKNPCFVSINARGTNEYRHKKSLAYMVDIHCDPFILNFFSLHGITVNKEAYSLSQLIQWIWRSQIRNELPITLYLPSERMRKLLKEYLYV